MGDSFDEVLHSCRRNSMKLAEFASQIGKLSPSSPDDAIKASRIIPEAESECQIMERALGTLKHLAHSAPSQKRDALVSKYTNLEQEIGANARKPLAIAIKKYRTKEADSGARSTLLQRGQPKDNSVVIELGIQENASLRNSSAAFGGIEAQARGILVTLSTSGERLKGAHRKVLPARNVMTRGMPAAARRFQISFVLQMLDVMGLVGLSNSVMRSIDKRHLGDKVVVWAGCVVTIIVVYFLIFWKRST